nr:YetF domain-containing protein [Budvicia diplopodorum]
MTLFEVVIILILGSAAGDVALNEDAAFLPVVITFIVIIGLHRLFTLLINKSSRLQRHLEGKPIVLIEDGQLHWENAMKQSFAFEEFTMELRQKAVTHIGQVKLAFVEIDGNLSVYYYKNEDVKPGLSTLPLSMIDATTEIKKPGIYACVKCSHVYKLKKCADFICPTCGGSTWSKASIDTRVL